MSGSARGESATVSAFRLPPPQPPRRSSSSGRAVQTTSIGTSLDQSTSGRRNRAARRRPSAGPRTPAPVDDDRPAPPGTGARRPPPRCGGFRRRPPRSQPGQRPQHAPRPRPPPPDRESDRQPSACSLPSASWAVSESRMPACALTISPSAQYRDAVAVGQRASLTPGDEVGSRSTACDQLHTRRLLPMPGTPTSVTSCTARSERQRRSASSSRSTSSPRPDQRRGRPLNDVDAQPRSRLDRLPDRQRL